MTSTWVGVSPISIPKNTILCNLFILYSLWIDGYIQIGYTAILMAKLLKTFPRKKFSHKVIMRKLEQNLVQTWDKKWTETWREAILAYLII